MLGISKRGDKYLRTLLIHGARTVLTRSKAPPPWALRLAERRAVNVVTVALANKTARSDLRRNFCLPFFHLRADTRGHVMYD